MTATAAKVAAQVAPDIVTGGIVAESGPRPDFTRWTVEDDILLKNSVEAGGAMEALAKGAVRFSRRYSVKELRDRWRALLYDPVVANEAAARIVEAETTLTDSSRAKVPTKVKGEHELGRKRRLNSVRTKYYKMRKRVAADRLDPVAQNEVPVSVGAFDQVQGSRSQGAPVEGKEVLSSDQVTCEDLALDLEDRTFSHMFSLLAAGGVGAVIGALPAAPSEECPGMCSGAADSRVGNGHVGSTAPIDPVSSSGHRDYGVVDTAASKRPTEKFVVRDVNNAEDTTVMANEQDLAVPDQSLCLEVQGTAAACPLAVSQLSAAVEDEILVPGHTFSGGNVQVHPALCRSESVEIFTKGEFCLSNTGAIPAHTTWFESSEPLRADIYVAGESFCCDDIKSAEVMVDKQTEEICREVQFAECESKTVASSGHLHNDGKMGPPQCSQCEISEYSDKSLWPSAVVIHDRENPVRFDAGPNSESEDDSSAFSDRQVDGELDALEAKESPSGMFQGMCGQSPPAADGISGTGIFMPIESFQLSEFMIPVPMCLLNTEDTDTPNLAGSLLLPSSQSLSQDGWGSWSEGLTTDASEVSRYACGNGSQTGAGDPLDTCKPNQGLMHDFSEGGTVNGGPAPEIAGRTNLCSVVTPSSYTPRPVAHFVSEELHPGIDAIWCHDLHAQQDGNGREVLETQFGIVPPSASEGEATNTGGAANFAPEATSKGLVNSEVLVGGTFWRNGDLTNDELPCHLGEDQSMQLAQGNGASEYSISAAHERQDYNNDDEPGSDLDMARFSDVEAMILDMDLDPGFDDEFSARAESRHSYRRHSRTLLRLEQGATAAIQRSLTLRGAIAILYGYKSRYFIKKAEVLLGRGTQDNVVDIDLTEEGRANKVSRRQAYIKLKEDGVFYLKNLGRRCLTVNNNNVQFNQRAILGSNCLIEVGGMRFIFEINGKLVKSRVSKLQPA